MLKQFDSMCDGHLGSAMAVQPQVELKQADNQPID